MRLIANIKHPDSNVKRLIIYDLEDDVYLDTIKNLIQVLFGTAGLRNPNTRLKHYLNMALTKMIGKKSQTQWIFANMIGLLLFE